jgi:hypothetical protein
VPGRLAAVPRPGSRRVGGHARELPPWEERGNLDEYDLVRTTRLAHLVEVCQPLVLVSQVQRSGGTLLSQLLDGHPECHAHSQELQIGHPNVRDWPDLDLGAPENWFPALYEPKAGERLRDGYSKAPRGEGQVFPFCFAPSLQQAIFEQCIGARRAEGARDVLDCYFTSYFNAWLDNHNLYTGPKKVVTAFAPGLATSVANVEGYFSVYPDGILISVVRDPRGWYGSARKYKPRLYEDVDQALPVWRASTEAALAAVERYGEKVMLLTYEQLVLETEETMRRVAGRIGISMSRVLLSPTFNGCPIRANSSDAVERYGILSERVSAHRAALDDTTLARVEELAGNLYDLAAVAAAG